MNEGEREEWDMPPQAERPSIAPEDQQRFRRLLTELLFSASGALCLGVTSQLFYRPAWTRPSASTGLWEEILYDWVPIVMFLLAFACVIWLITIPMRMAALKKE